MRWSLLLVLCIFFICSLQGALGENITVYDERIAVAFEDMSELSATNIPINRYNDTLTNLLTIYQGQKLVQSQEGNPDFQVVDKMLDDLNRLHGVAFRSHDELLVLEETIASETEIESSELEVIALQARNAFEKERFEDSLKFIEDAHAKISEQKATATKVRALYDATTNNTIQFLSEHWKDIFVIAFVFFGLTVLFHHPLRRYFIRRKIKELEMQKGAIEKLMQESQKHYFEKKNLDENTYHIRVKKYGQHTREINRMIPLLHEEIALHQGKVIFNPLRKNTRKSNNGKYKKDNKKDNSKN